MGRWKVFDRRHYTLNLDVVLMDRLKKVSSNVSETVNQLIESYLTRIEGNLEDIDFKKQQVLEEIDSLKGELGLLDKEKNRALEVEKRAEQEKVLENKRELMLRERTEKTKQVLVSMGVDVKSMSELTEAQRDLFWKKWGELHNDKAKA